MRLCAVLWALAGCVLDVSGLRQQDRGAVEVADGGDDATAETADARSEPDAPDAGEERPEGREVGDVGAEGWEVGQDAPREATAACGAPRAPCCPGEGCAADAVCVRGWCMPCGTLGSLCCVTRCAADTACAAGFCVACGLPGRVCCDGRACSGGAVCGNDGLCR